MGNTAIVTIQTDALHIIENDPEFGKRLVSAIHKQHGDSKPSFFASSGKSSSSAGEVIEVHHNDSAVMVISGGGTAYPFGYVGWHDLASPEKKVEALKRIAEDMGFSLRKKPAKTS